MPDPEAMAKISLAPVNRHDLATFAAQTTLALRSLKLALMSVPLNDPEIFQEHLKESDKAIDQIWQVFEEYRVELQEALKAEKGAGDER